MFQRSLHQYPLPYRAGLHLTDKVTTRSPLRRASLNSYFISKLFTFQATQFSSTSAQTSQELKFQPLRGMFDRFDEEARGHQWVEETARNIS